MVRQNLLVGANWRSIVGPLARAALIKAEGANVSKTRQDEAAALATAAFHVCPNFDLFVPLLLEGDVMAIQDRLVHMKDAL